MVAISYNNRSPTQLSINITGLSNAATFTQWQYATRSDFRFCIAPVIPGTFMNPQVFGGLNRSQTYYWRAREGFADGSVSLWSNVLAVATLEGADTPYAPGIQIQPALIVVPEIPTQWGAANTVAGYPVLNLSRPSPVAAWRATAAPAGSNTYYFWLETNGRPIDTVALLETNLPEDATVFFRGGSSVGAVDNSGSNPGAREFETPVVPFRASPNIRGRRGYHGFFRLATPITSRWLGFIVIATVPGELLHITHAVVGSSRVLKNYGDMSDQPFDLGTVERLRDGTPDAVAGFRGRKVDFELAVMTESQHEIAFADLGQRVGSTDPVVVVPNTKTGPFLHDRILFGNITQSRQSNANMRFSRNLTIESIINP